MVPFYDLGQIEDRRWLIPSCPICPHPPNAQRRPIYEELRESGEKGCAKCKLFTQSISTICPAEAHHETVEWTWNYSVLTGYQTRHGDAEGTVSDYKIEFFIHPDSRTIFGPHCHTLEFHVGQLVPDTTDDDETLRRIRSWYSSCVKSHDLCKSKSDPYRPTRLLDIASPQCESGVRLLDTQEELPDSHIDYVCLSHCWGKSKLECISLKYTLAKNRAGIQWKSLPKTFQDVIVFLRRLDFRYLWIDSICIVQDDTADWAREAASMCNVYYQSALTVAATNSPDSHHRLHSTLSDEYRSHAFSLPLNDGHTTLPVWCRRPIPHLEGSETHSSSAIENAPLLQRGWVLQERLLSRRVLHFCANEVVWECLHGSKCQCSDSNADDDDDRFPSPKNQLGLFLHGLQANLEGDVLPERWFEVVEQYTRLALTFTEDRFPALSGAAQRSRQYRDGDTYVAGLWERQIIQGLTWCARGPLRARPKNWVAPTWSWASIDGGVWWPGAYREISKQFLASAEPRCVPASSDLTGRLASASMTVRGCVTDGVLLWEDDDDNDNSSSSVGLQDLFAVQFGARKMTRCFWPDYTLRQEEENLVPHSSEILWLPVLEKVYSKRRREKEYAGLVLRVSEREPGTFERIGRLQVESTEDHEFMMARAEERTLVLV
ncbi:heterokaryon incompatibility protein-domain-containing protein [Xylaria arbuscula]|nr:heterokaryon incompatibility protein-domain-containing protein [Xylaria arbuscula]